MHCQPFKGIWPSIFNTLGLGVISKYSILTPLNCLNLLLSPTGSHQTVIPLSMTDFNISSSSKSNTPLSLAGIVR